MQHSSAKHMQPWTGPALFSFGFRPFFLFGSLWVVVAMMLWMASLAGVSDLPTRFDPVSWHAHEFLFGYLGAVLAGFLLTAVPNWTGRSPMTGWPLAGLFALWLAGRVAVLTSDLTPTWLPVSVDLAFPLILAACILKEIVVGKNWRNLIILALLAVFILANLMFHLQALSGSYAAQDIGLRLGLGTVIMMIGVIGGRIIPSFTGNWLAKQGHDARPAPPMQRFDKLTLLTSIPAILFWVFAPNTIATGVLLIAMGAMHTARLSRWCGLRTLKEPLIWVLHAAYAFIPIGAFALGVDSLTGAGMAATAQHLWMSGAIGAMTLAVMTRATLGHTGHPLHANAATLMIFLALFGSVAARCLTLSFPQMNLVSGLLWIAAFGGFVLIYSPMMLRPRKPAATG